MSPSTRSRVVGSVVAVSLLAGCSCEGAPAPPDARVVPDAAAGIDAREFDAQGPDAAEDSPSVDVAVPRTSCDTTDPRQLAACAAAVRTACAPRGGRMDDTEGFVLQQFGFDAATRDCLVAAGSDCARAQECIGDRLEPGGCVNTCEGDTRTDGLFEGWCRRIDCARTAPGNTCLMYDSMDPFDPPFPVCTTAECLGRAGTQCLGDDVEECAGRSTRIVRECAESSPCRMAAGVFDCLPNGSVCADGTAAQCTGPTELTYCSGGRLGTLDCGELGGRCETGPGGAECVYDSDLCGASGTSGTRCDGDDIVYCSYARVSRVHCPDLGFTRCGTFGGLPTCLPVAEGRVRRAVTRR
jgi:hypothetical protein